MKLAISNIAWTGEQDTSIYEFLKEQGIEGLEIAPTRILSDDPYQKVQEAKVFAERLKGVYGLEVSAIQSICNGRTENIFEQPEGRELVKYLKEGILFAEAIGSKNVVFGCPKNRILTDMWLAGKFPKVAWKRITSIFSDLGKFAMAHNTVFAFEPVPESYGTNFINTTKEAMALIEDVECPGFRLCINLGGILENQEPISIMKDCRDMISHVHISEPGLMTPRRRRIHGELADILASTGYEGYVSVDMRQTRDREKVKTVVKYLKEVFG